MSSQSLRQKTIQGTFWSAADAFLGQGITFLVGLVLARLLTPDEYGLISICLIVNTILNGVVDSGFSSALIRKTDAADEDYNTMFFTNLVVSIVLYVVVFWVSPLLARFFERPELTTLIRATGLVLVIQALSLTQMTILSKRIDFKTKTYASFISALLSGGIGIWMAIAGYGVWALVGQLLSKQLIYTVVLWILCKWLPRFRLSLDSFKYMWGFGWKLLLSGLLNNTWNQLYQLVVGKFYSPATLGQYTRSRQIAAIFSENLTLIVQRVSYPALSEIQDEKERMVFAYRRVIKITMFVTCICMFAIGAVAEPLIYCLIGPQWAEAATYLPLICISMSLYPLHAINLNMLQVQGRSDIFLNLEIVKKIIAVLPICIGIFIGIYWMLVASIFTGIISFFLNSYYTGKELGYSSWMQLRDVAPDYAIALVVALSIYFIKFIPVSYWVILPSQFIIGLVVVFLICENTRLMEYQEVKEAVLIALKKVRLRCNGSK